MGSAPKRIAHEVLIAWALMLGSCMKYPPGPDTGQMAKVANTNARMALVKCENLDRRLSIVEAKLSTRR